MLKYVGVLLTTEQLFKIASSILQEDFEEKDSDDSFLRAYGTVQRILNGNRPKYFIHPMSIPRHSEKDEDTRFLIVCRSYDNPYETRMNYANMPATKRDARILGWLKGNGMDFRQMLDQWTTMPDPAYDL
ncbi:uncharacterized protein FOMMEDRAFT_16915 [Fomitiporia mediterranea MF3/22]|uniref:uncharacterized protein n=1 Tax=Fomitiporia mediterranea (strain MF3/22) TaxID=694068 RepID=UPI0004408EC3|nr:uncharacterized protein FOMMEDRAFT_16915 [Fomitiporia mediterranea MF3/22]EJD08600.1 hypothetical protein FOMMEDRAFT_16915 [Fomitiporia mediterranea MF3/22]